MDKLFHVQSVFDAIVDEFYPRIPPVKMVLEDDIIPRICLSSTIAGALKGMQLFHIPNAQTSYRNGVKGAYIRVYVFDEYKPEMLVYPSELVAKDYVPDAMFTQEHWYLDFIKPSDIFYVFVEMLSVTAGLNYYKEPFVFECVEEDELFERV